MGFSDILDQVLVRASRQEITEVMREEITMEECNRFHILLLVARSQAFNYTEVEAVAGGQVNTDILCAEDRADITEYKCLQAEELKCWEQKIRDTADHEANKFLKSTEELLAQSGIDQHCKKLNSIIQALSNKTEFKFIPDHMI